MNLSAERVTKTFWPERQPSQKPQLVAVRDETDQARYVAERVLDYRECGIALTSQAVLFRSSSHSTLLELERARPEIPPNRIRAFRAVRIVRGVGTTTATRLQDAIDAASDPMSIIGAFPVPA